MNVFIMAKNSGNYYNLFDVSLIEISINKFSEKGVINIHVENETLHLYMACYCEKKYLIKKYQDMEDSIKTDCVLNIIADIVYKEEVR